MAQVGLNQTASFSSFSLLKSFQTFLQTFLFLSSFLLPSFILSLLPLSSAGVPSPLSARPVWRRCGKSSWRHTAPPWASSPRHPAPPAPSPAYWSSSPAGLASGAPTPSFEPSQCDIRPSFCFHPSIHS